jgi:hypothetical protein
MSSTWGKSTFILKLLCEHDEMHLADHPGYPIQDPREFLRKAGPIISFAVTVLLQAVVGGANFGMKPIGGPTLSTPIFIPLSLQGLGERPTEYLERLNEILDSIYLSEELKNKDSKLGKRATFDGPTSKLVEDGKKHSNVSARLMNAKGAALRELAVFLEKFDKAKSYGNLNKIVLPGGRVRWMCDHHASLYHTDDEQYDKFVQIPLDE